MPARIVIVSGATGSGKSSITKRLTESSTYERAVHLHTDDFYQYIRKGYISPWLDGSDDQNKTMIEAAAVCAREFCRGGYEVYVDGVIGPWYLTPGLAIAKEGMDVRYIVLRPSEQITVTRAARREQRDYFPLTAEVVSEVWQAFSDLGSYESHAIDTGVQTVEESVAEIRRSLRRDGFRIS